MSDNLYCFDPACLVMGLHKHEEGGTILMTVTAHGSTPDAELATLRAEQLKRVKETVHLLGPFRAMTDDEARAYQKAVNTRFTSMCGEKAEVCAALRERVERLECALGPLLYVVNRLVCSNHLDSGECDELIEALINPLDEARAALEGDK